MSKKKKKSRFKRLKNPYRLSIINENTYEEKFSTFLTPLHVLAFGILIFAVSGGIIYVLVALTPLKQYLVPDFSDYEYRQDARFSRLMVDSLLEQNEKKDKWIADLQHIMSGEDLPGNAIDTVNYIQSVELNYDVMDEDSLLRERVAKEDRYDINVGNGASSTLANLYLYKPVNGSISSGFDAKIGHYGIDIIAPEDEVVRSVLDGTVILASYTTDAGNVIQVQHSHNLISVYKHNATLFKETGDPVKAGESIAVIGNSGYHSDGPHLHFELWLDGMPVNPLDYMAFEN